MGEARILVEMGDEAVIDDHQFENASLACEIAPPLN